MMNKKLNVTFPSCLRTLMMVRFQLGLMICFYI